MWISKLYPTHGMDGKVFGLGAGRRAVIVRVSRTHGLFVRVPFGWRLPL